MLLATIVALSFFSALNMYGIAGAQSSFFIKHVIFIVAGIGIMMLFSFFNYRFLKNNSLPVFIVYIISVLLLIVPFFFQAIRGVRSWITVGGFTFEPAELAKLALIVLMAKYFSQRHIHIHQFRHIFVSGIYFIIPLIIILVQPDLGSSVIFVCIWLGILLSAGINKKHIFALIILAVLAGYGGWLFVLKPYQKERVVSFINPYADPRGAGYNLIQSKIAIGSGHWLGAGLGQGSQVKLGFLPEPHNDFVFASAAEQFGLLGIAFVLTSVLVIISRILLIGERAMSNFGKLFCIGMAILIFAHAFIGAGVNIGIMPVTGLPFPFLSYGGSHFLSLMIGLGIVQSIRRYR